MEDCADWNVKEVGKINASCASEWLKLRYVPSFIIFKLVIELDCFEK